MSVRYELRLCGHGCIFGRPRGMATNGACHCLSRYSEDREAELRYRRNVMALRQRIRELEEALPDSHPLLERKWEIGP